jgi:cysteine-rich repeat protein
MKGSIRPLHRIFGGLLCSLALFVLTDQLLVHGQAEQPSAQTQPQAANAPAAQPIIGLQIPTAVCGNGIIEAAEACDDGNTANGDGCTNACAIEQSCYDPGNTFSFFTWSDSYGAAGNGGVMRVFRDTVNRTLYPTRVLPRLWFSAGDTPYVPGLEQLSIEDLNEEISGDNYPFTCAASNRQFPLFVALGNHDLDGDTTSEITTKMAYWRDQIGPQVDKTLVGIQNFRWGPDNGYDARTTYSFDYKNTHFVVYNQYYGDPGYPTPNPLACVRQSMYEWIDQDLTNTNRPIKIVVGHEPAWSYCGNAPGYNGCITYNDFFEDYLNPGHRPRPHSTSGTAWLEPYGRHSGDSLEDVACPVINGQEGRSAFWQMLARHKVVAHMVGHTHTYGSRLVDADGPRNDALLPEVERNRMAYGKNGDVFTNATGVWEVDSGMTHNSAGAVYVLVTVRDNRVTFEAWDQIGINENEEPFRLVESWHVDVEDTAPAPSLAATTASTVRINLSWTDPSNDESGFKIERSPDGLTGWTQIATVGANVTTFANTGLTCGRSYSYRVRAYNSSGNGPYSNVATAATRLCTPALQPITGIAQTQLTLTWTDANQTESGFKIERSPNGVNSWSEIATPNANATAYTNSGLLCETPYFYRMRTYAGNTNSPYSNVVTASTAACLADLIFADGVESGNLLAWSARAVGGGDLRVNGAAALIGSQGMEAVIDDNISIHVRDDLPNAEARYHARFYFDPNGLTMAHGNAHYLFYGYQSASPAVLRVELRRYNNAYQVRAALLNDSTTWFASNYVTIRDRPYVIEVDWQAATAPGANNGRLDLWVNEVEVANLTGIDNDTRRIDRVRLGPVAGLDSGTRGSYFFDAFESRRFSYIGPVSGARLTTDNADPIVAPPTTIPLTTTLVQTAEENRLLADAAGVGVQIRFPAAAVDAPLTATIALTEVQTAPAGYALFGEMLALQVTAPATVVLDYQAIQSTIEPTATLTLQHWVGAANQWETLAAQVNPAEQTVTAAIAGAGIFALWQQEVEQAAEEISDGREGKSYFLYLPLAEK